MMVRLVYILPSFPKSTLHVLGWWQWGIIIFTLTRRSIWLYCTVVFFFKVLWVTYSLLSALTAYYLEWENESLSRCDAVAEQECLTRFCSYCVVGDAGKKVSHKRYVFRFVNHACLGTCWEFLRNPNESMTLVDETIRFSEETTVAPIGKKKETRFFVARVLGLEIWKTSFPFLWAAYNAY